MEKGFLWCLSGAVWWLSAHSMTLLYPLAGPFIPVGAAIPAGVLMGLVALYIPTRNLTRWLLICSGFVAGCYLGWVFARGPIRGDAFLPPMGADQAMGALICGILGIAANAGTIWTMQRFSERPLKLLSVLLFLLLIMLAAVTAVTLLTQTGPVAALVMPSLGLVLYH